MDFSRIFPALMIVALGAAIHIGLPGIVGDQLFPRSDGGWLAPLRSTGGTCYSSSIAWTLANMNDEFPGIGDGGPEAIKQNFIGMGLAPEENDPDFERSENITDPYAIAKIKEYLSRRGFNYTITEYYLYGSSGRRQYGEGPFGENVAVATSDMLTEIARESREGNGMILLYYIPSRDLGHATSVVGQSGPGSARIMDPAQGQFVNAEFQGNTVTIYDTKGNVFMEATEPRLISIEPYKTG